jgi:hypothetical protein
VLEACHHRRVMVTNHVLAGATIGVLLRRRPALAFAAGVASHLAMDACPHWGPLPDDPRFAEKFLRVARCDGCIGLAAMAIAAGAAPGGSRKATFAGMLGAAVVDADKPCQHFFGFTPFPAWFQAFHGRIQREAPNRLAHEIGLGVALAALAGAALRRSPLS